MYDLGAFTLRDMTACGSALRALGAGDERMEQVAVRVVRYLYENLVSKTTGARCCALVRFFKTHPYGQLIADLRVAADRMLVGQAPSAEMKCLTLLASAGDRPEWNDRRRSVGHLAIPLASERLVSQAPMISNLIKQFGLDIKTVLQPDRALLMDLEQRSYNVFYVPEAAGSPYVPAQQEFVAACGIRSVVGFGGLLPSGDLFAIILFSKVPISRETAGMFKTLALNVKVALLSVVAAPVFIGSP